MEPFLFIIYCMISILVGIVIGIVQTDKEWHESYLRVRGKPFHRRKKK